MRSWPVRSCWPAASSRTRRSRSAEERAMEPRDKMFWAALGGSVLAGFYFLHGSVYEGEASADELDGHDEDHEVEGQGGSHDSAADRSLPAYGEMDERTAL